MSIKLRVIGSWLYNNVVGLLVNSSQHEVKNITPQHLQEIVKALDAPANHSLFILECGHGKVNAIRYLKSSIGTLLDDFKFIVDNYQSLESDFMELSPKELKTFAITIHRLTLDDRLIEGLYTRDGKVLKTDVIDKIKNQFVGLKQFLLNLEKQAIQPQSV